VSARDYQLYHTLLPALVGRKSFITLAANSIKLHIDENKKGGIYLWIDPPWVFGKNNVLIESSESCPDYRAPNYRRLFSDWVARFSAISGSEIVRIAAKPSGRLSIRFRHSYSLIAPASFDEHGEPSWYDHWYYADPETT
jgi:hypothetical protein